MKRIGHLVLTDTEQAAVGAHAAMYINDGHSPYSLAHMLWQDGDALGVSYPLPPGSDLSGLTERYYTLGELAFD